MRTEEPTTLVVGASGHLGGAVVARLDEAGHRAVGTHCSTPVPWTVESFDFWTDDPHALVDRHDPAAVVFAAAPEYAATDTGAGDSAASVGERAARFADACADRRLVYVSSDAVFDGETGGYIESDDRSPRDPYGRNLVAFEDAVRAACPDAVCLRTSYQYGVSRGRLDPRLTATLRAVRAGEAVTYFSDMCRSPVPVGTVARIVVSLVRGSATGVLHVPGPRTSVHAFHRDAVAALGHDAEPVAAEQMPRDADFARDRSLRSERFASVVDIDVPRVSDALAGVDGDTLPALE